MGKDVANKILGYLLLVVGLVMIFYPVLNVYEVFRGKTLPYHLFNFKPISLELSKFVEGAPQNTNLTQELVPSDVLNKPLDLVAHVILWGFVASAGFKIASLGVMMVRTIKVNLKEEKGTSAATNPNKPTWK